VLDGVGGQRHVPAALTLWKDPHTHCIGGWVGQCGRVRKMSPLTWISRNVPLGTGCIKLKVSKDDYVYLFVRPFAYFICRVDGPVDNIKVFSCLGNQKYQQQRNNILRRLYYANKHILLLFCTAIRLLLPYIFLISNVKMQVLLNIFLQQKFNYGGKLWNYVIHNFHLATYIRRRSANDESLILCLLDRASSL